ncbi:arylformamidase [Saprolegnia diclina VS20]|uniref:Arylformamidase n=1 Tax=Saprolegnia diclina (strain VS20) TaxID=1156394 RepID=T0QEP3_SAPDV|nr:arylformamidase [Saprolegnia diclina VS20]EQC32035.1 arylformamidase [Saprolegnia diclina VS20]|eukprot:XP_008614437.1 arylformamidase [Saprolegnia diclina VS20]
MPKEAAPLVFYPGHGYLRAPPSSSRNVSVTTTTTERAACHDLRLWRMFTSAFARAKHIDLTHTMSPETPVWSGFPTPPAQFRRATNATSGEPYTWAADGFAGMDYRFETDQFGTQLDPPAHWHPDYAAIDELPPTFAVRPLVVLGIVDKVKADAGYQLQVADILSWEKTFKTKIPRGAVVFVRSDWAKQWGVVPPQELAAQFPFPGQSLASVQFLHLNRSILFHGHEPLDTDTSPTLESEAWLLQNGYTQAEGVADLDGVPETGCLVQMGFPKLRGGLGGYARYIAICPPSTRIGVAINAGAETPLPKQAKLLRYVEGQGYLRV